MKHIQVLIKGTDPLLLHRFDAPEEIAEPTRRITKSYGTPQEQAERGTYRDEKGNLVVPTSALARMLRDSGGNHKLRGSRRSARFVVPSAVRVQGEYIPLTNGDGSTPLTHFCVDSRPVTNAATKGRILAHRPRFNHWSLRFVIRVNELLLEPDFVKNLMIEGGEQLGIGTFRIEKGGPFGSFTVVEWSEVP